jgi:glucose/arabinose dehydrogenase
VYRLQYFLAIYLIPITLLLFVVDNNISFSRSDSQPLFKDTNLTSELVFNGTINGITNMAILDTDDILVLERANGTVKRVVNGEMYPEPLIDLNVTLTDGLLGIATSENGSRKYVFLYYTEAPRGFGKDVDVGNLDQVASVNNTFGYIRECNCLYRYELLDNKLINGKLLLELPAKPGGIQHHGGEIIVGPDNYLYIVIGDLGGRDERGNTKAQNFKDGPDPDGRAGIIRVTQDGQPPDELVLGEEYPLNLYYAYGIRNSFGLDFDPVTDNLWDTENGPDYGDEINLVEPGFNSGWSKIMGPTALKRNSNITDLEDFGGKGTYSDPKFTWMYPIGPTAIKFLDSGKLGKEYENDLFVADVNNGYIYHFELNHNRTELIMDDQIRGNVAYAPDLAFAKEFGGGITDLQVGPDGYLYVLSDGGIFKIVSRKSTISKADWINEDPKVLDVGVNVSIKKGNTTTWSVLSTDFISVKPDVGYLYQINISANDVNQLHSKVYYYYSNKTEIKWDFVTRGTDGTYKKLFTNTLETPSNSSYAKLQLWVRPNPNGDSTFSLDNVDVNQIDPAIENAH